MKIADLVKTLQSVQKGFGNIEVMVNGTGKDYNIAYAVRSLSLTCITEPDKLMDRKRPLTYQAVVFVPDEDLDVLGKNLIAIENPNDL